MDIAERVAELVQIPSVNPLHAGPISGDGGERELSDWLANHAEALGADVVVDEVEVLIILVNKQKQQQKNYKK